MSLLAKETSYWDIINGQSNIQWQNLEKLLKLKWFAMLH